MPSINPWYRSLALTLCCLVVNGACPVSWAQQTPGASPHLVITILDGEGALNDIRQRTAREPIIGVPDRTTNRSLAPLSCSCCRVPARAEDSRTDRRYSRL